MPTPSKSAWPKTSSGRPCTADQFEAFKAVIDEGNAVADVAARFGVSEAVVAKRLKWDARAP
jgi:hypothetical protein